MDGSSLPLARGVLVLAVQLLVAFALFPPPGASGQEVGVLAVRATSGNPEFPHSGGLGAYVQLEAAGWETRLSWLRYSDDTEKSGTVCQVYSPRIGCRTEGVATSARLSGLRLTVMRSFGFGEVGWLGMGGGLSFNSLSARSVGESGQRADLYMPNTGQIGYVGSASVGVSPFSAVPVRLSGGASGHWIRFNGCASDEDRTSGYAPFCGWERFVEVQVGVSVVIPRPGP